MGAQHGAACWPFLAGLDGTDECRFIDRCAALLPAALPAREAGKVPLPCPRLFFIATPRRWR